jgi:2-polyprenyl-3-methyl-5-hydroxy-6-metoxy-1,4-benzoquinol methylase
MQSKIQVENWYKASDPWKYKTNEDDAFRKEKIIDACGKGHKTALDIGAGEGWITKDLPADKSYGIEWSDAAGERFPSKVERLDKPEGKYDLVVATGILYAQYDYEQVTRWILEHTGKRAVLSNIMDWEILDERLLDKVVREEVFDYREFKQHLMVLDFG